MTTPVAADEQTAVVRKRRFTLRSVDDIVRLAERIKLERCECEVKIIFRCGGTPTSAEVEERSRLT